MDNRSLMLLGLLMSQSQHGYQIHDFIEKNLQFMTDLKKSTAYATLDKLSNEEYIDVEISQEGNRPPRKVYSINNNGIAFFNELLLQNVTIADNIFYDGDIGYMFIDYLQRDEAIPALKMRLAHYEELLANIKVAPVHKMRPGVKIAISHKTAMFETEILFLEKTIQQLSRPDPLIEQTMNDKNDD